MGNNGHREDNRLHGEGCCYARQPEISFKAAVLTVDLTGFLFIPAIF
jgi:hypothetical protein